MIREYLNLAWLCTPLVLLSACNNQRVQQAGIEGSGITTSAAVTAIGSIIVAGVEYDVSGAVITINGSPALEADLARGHVAIVEGRLLDDGASGVATRVQIEIPVAGRVAAVDLERNRLTILGQTISIEENSIIVDGVEGVPLRGLGIGRDVEVSGFIDASGVLHASRIEPRRAATPLLITGVVADLDTGDRTFSINGQAVSYATATLRGFESLSAGKIVRVSSTAGLSVDTVVADEVVAREAALPGDVGDEAEVQGWVTRFVSENEFDIDGHPIFAADDIILDGIAQANDAFVSVSGSLIQGGVVLAKTLSTFPPGRLVGVVTVDEIEYGLNGLMTRRSDFRLNIEELSAGPLVTDSGLGQLVASFEYFGREISGEGVLIGEACGLQPAGRLCGKASRVRIEATRSGTRKGVGGASGVIRVATDEGEEVWPLSLSYAGARGGFASDSFELLDGLYELRQAEFAQGSGVVMSVASDGRLYFQSPDTGCIGNGEIGRHMEGDLNLYDVTLELDACTGSFAYLNAEFQGLATLEGLTPWDYNQDILSIWVSTPVDAESAAAITFWGTYIYE